MTNTIVTQDWSEGFAMPVSDRVRVCALRTSQAPAGSGAARHTSALSSFAPVQESVLTRAMGYSTADVVDLAITEDTFPGTSAWSPPI